MSRYKKTFLFFAIFSSVIGFYLFLFQRTTVNCQIREAYIIEMEGAITPGSAALLSSAMKEAEKRMSTIIIIRLDTPGGLDFAMRGIVKNILNSKIPVVVYVGPKGAGAASAGVMITIAGHIAAMAPGTNIGAAHPVFPGGKDIENVAGKTMSEKVLNDIVSYARGIAKERGKNAEWVEKAIRESVSITAEEALENNVIDLIAEDIDTLIKSIDGREVTISAGKVTLNTANLEKTFHQPNLRDRILKVVSQPYILALLVLIGIAGLYLEFTNPGIIIPGVIGAICLTLALFSMQALPVNTTGVILIILGIVLFIAELKVTSYGLLSIGGLISFTLGAIMFFRDMGISITFIVISSICIGIFFMAVAALALKAHRSKPKSGSEGLIGETGRVSKPIDPEGLVFVHGEYWNALADERIESGEKVEVIGMEGLVLKVKKI